MKLNIKQNLQDFWQKRYEVTYPFRIAVWLVILWGFTSIAYADGLPHESLQFVFEYESKDIPIVDGQLIHCDDIECQNGKSQEHDDFHCEMDTCVSILGFYSEYSEYKKLSIVFEDKSRESNVFKKEAHQAKYLVTVKDDRLFVEEVSSWFDILVSPGLLIIAILFFSLLISTLVAELIVGLIFAWIAKIPQKTRLLGWIAVANIISLSVVWWVLYTYGIPIISLEVFVVVFEVLFLYLTNRKRGLTIVNAGLLSVVMNTVSYLLGLAIADWIGIGLF